MSLIKSNTLRHRLALVAGSAFMAANFAAGPASAQVAPGPEVAFPTGGAFVNLAPTTGNDTVTVAAGNALYLPLIGNSGGSTTVPEDTYAKDFLGGVNTITNNGYVFVGTESGEVTSTANPREVARYEAEMRIVNLTTFQNNGSIYLGSFYRTANSSTSAYLVGTDLWNDDILSMEGAHFIGGAGSRIVLDAEFNSFGQDACSAALRSTGSSQRESGTLPANDCINLAGGSAGGTTLVRINPILNVRGAYNPDGNVIVDLTGGDAGATDPNAFIIDPESESYDPTTGVIDRGIFAYALAYDSDLQQFRLYGVQAAGAQQFPLLAGAAGDLWRTATGGWFERQVDQRGLDADAGRGGGVWGRVVANRAEREDLNALTVGDSTILFDNSYEQETTAATFGADLISADGVGGSWTLGAMVGYARSRVDFEASGNMANLEGMHGGVYGAFTAGQFFVDAAVNGTWLDLDHDVPALNLLPTGTELATTIQSVGARMEAGWRLRRDRFTVEPLAGLTYVRTTFDDLTVPAPDTTRLGGEVVFDDAVSLRGSVGVRFTIDDVLPVAPTSRLSLTARHGPEFDGDATASIVNVGPQDAPVADAFDGSFSEISAALTLANADGNVAGYVNLGGQFGEDYEGVTASAGFRYQW